jgi:putative heme transporter
VSLRRILLAVTGLAVVVATFVFFLPTIADYGDVWEAVKQLSAGWIVLLVAVTALSIAVTAPPWMAALPGIRYVQSLELTQATTAISLVVPGGTAAGVATSWAVLRKWGFVNRDITRAITLTSLWNQFFNLLFPILAVFFLTATGAETALLATAAFVGVAVLGVVLTGFVLALMSDRLARDVGDLAARLCTWAKAKLHRGPVPWNGVSFERFRDSAGELLRRRWHVLTVASLVASLSVFVVLLVSLRALNVPAAEVSAVEAFAAWALVRLLAAVPITPGGVGIVELGLTTSLVGFGGDNARVVAAVLVYRLLTTLPTIVLGLLAAATLRRHLPSEPVPDVPAAPTLGP